MLRGYKTYHGANSGCVREGSVYILPLAIWGVRNGLLVEVEGTGGFWRCKELANCPLTVAVARSAQPTSKGSAKLVGSGGRRAGLASAQLAGLFHCVTANGRAVNKIEPSI